MRLNPCHFFRFFLRVILVEAISAADRFGRAGPDAIDAHKTREHVTHDWPMCAVAAKKYSGEHRMRTDKVSRVKTGCKY